MPAETEPGASRGIRFEDVCLGFGSTQALDGIDLDLDAGRTTVLLGPSGCGKSTVLRLVTGLLRADSGRIRVGDRDLADLDLPEWRHRLGYVIQEGGLFPHLSTRENLALLPEHLGWERARITARIEELLALVRLDADLLARFPAELSGGQRQRVSLLRALVHDPEYLLLDEPLGALDPMVRAELQEDLRAVFRALDKTVVFVTHDLAEAAWFADHVVILRAGRVEQSGGFEEIGRDPASAFVRRFFEAQRGAAW